MKICEMVCDYTFKNGYKEVVSKVVCDSIKHITYVKVMGNWCMGDTFPCPCAIPVKESK